MILWIIMLINELAFLICTLKMGKGKKAWFRNRLLVRSVQMVLYWIAILLPGVRFDFRYRGLFILLLFLWIIALVRWLMKKNVVEGNKKTFGLIMGSIGTAFLFFIALVPSFLFTGYEGLETTGIYEVTQTEAILMDKNRLESMEEDGSYREVPVHFYYPKTESEEHRNAFPLVLFSHGAFGYYQSNSSSYLELASRGYVVVSLDHPYHSFFTKDTNGKIITVDPAFMQEVMYVNDNNTPENDIFDTSSRWVSIRTADINFVLDQIQIANAKDEMSDSWYYNDTSEEALFDAIKMAQCDNIGLYGHSLGGASAVSVGRQRKDVKAVIDLDGTMLGEQVAFEDGKYSFQAEPYPVPVFAINTEYHHIASIEYGDLYVNNHVIENALDGKSTYFKNAGHMNFTDLPLFSPVLASMLGTGSIDEESCIKQTNELVSMYFDHYLKNEGEVVIQEYYE